MFDGEYLNEHKKFGTLYREVGNNNNNDVEKVGNNNDNDAEPVFYGFLDDENHRIEGNQFNQDKTRPFKYNRSALVCAAKNEPIKAANLHGQVDDEQVGIKSNVVRLKVFDYLLDKKIKGILHHRSKFYQALKTTAPYPDTDLQNKKVDMKNPDKSLDESKKNNQNEKK